MKATGIVRNIDDLGRIVIPKSLRKTKNIKVGDPLELFVDGDNIIYRKFDTKGNILSDIERISKNICEELGTDKSKEIIVKLGEIMELVGNSGNE